MKNQCWVFVLKLTGNCAGGQGKVKEFFQPTLWQYWFIFTNPHCYLCNALIYRAMHHMAFHITDIWASLYFYKSSINGQTSIIKSPLSRVTLYFQFVRLDFAEILLESILLMNLKNECILYRVNYVTSIFDLTHDLDLGFLEVKFWNSCNSGIIGLIDVKQKGSKWIR